MTILGRKFTIQKKTYHLDPDLRKLLKENNVGREDIEREYSVMNSYTPGLKLANYNHAAYQALMKKIGRL
jgi:hypothetical protein